MLTYEQITKSEAIKTYIILADKADVRRSRVRNTDPATFDIHDRVNYSVKNLP